MLADLLAPGRVRADLRRVSAAEARDDRGEGQAVEALQETAAKRASAEFAGEVQSALARVSPPGSPPLESASSHA